MSENGQPTLLVTGASGHMGRRVLELLLETHKGPIVAATRTPEKLAEFSQRGVIVRHADFEDPASLAKAFEGVNRMLLISTDVLDEGGTRLNQHCAAVKAADEAGVQHVIYTSITKPEPETPVFVSRDHYGTETALAATKMGYTFLRNNIYADLQPGNLNRAVQMGQLFNAAGDGKIAYVTREDCSQAAAAALASSFEGRRALDITGPEALSQADVAVIVTKITGKQVTYVSVELEAAVQGMVGAGLPRWLAEAYASFDAGAAQGKFDSVSNDVEELTGRKPMSFSDFLASERDALLQGVVVH